LKEKGRFLGHKDGGGVVVKLLMQKSREEVTRKEENHNIKLNIS